MKLSEVKNSILREISILQLSKKQLLVAIDGRSASGKTTLGMSLKDSLGCNLIHMDHFFLPIQMRSEERMSQPGGNADIERFILEILAPLKNGAAFSYSPYDCHLQKMADPIEIDVGDICIIEGAYACHPRVSAHYDLRIFLNIDEQSQIARIRKRNGEEDLKIFIEKWIPLEEAYFSTYRISETCDMFFTL